MKRPAATSKKAAPRSAPASRPLPTESPAESALDRLERLLGRLERVRGVRHVELRRFRGRDVETGADVDSAPAAWGIVWERAPLDMHGRPAWPEAKVTTLLGCHPSTLAVALRDAVQDLEKEYGTR